MIRRAANITIRVAILPVVMLAAFLLFPATSQACSGLTEPPNYTPPSIAERVKAARYVFDGNISINTGSRITVNVRKYFEGTGPSVVDITGFSKGADCHEIAPQGQAIFFTWDDPATTVQVGNYWEFGILPGPVFGYRFTEPYSDELAKQIIAATGHQPVLPVEVTVWPSPTLRATTPAITPTINPTSTAGGFTPSATTVITSTTQPQETSLDWLAPVVGGLVVLIVGLGGLFLLRNRRNS